MRVSVVRLTGWSALADELLLQLGDVLLERRDEREVLVDQEVHQGVEDEAGALGQQRRRRLAARPQRGVRAQRAVPHGDHVAAADEDVGLPEGDAGGRPSHLGQLGGAQHHEQGVLVLLQLGALVGPVGVLDGQVVQAELALHHPQQGLVRLVQPDPDERRPPGPGPRGSRPAPRRRRAARRHRPRR